MALDGSNYSKNMLLSVTLGLLTKLLQNNGIKRAQLVGSNIDDCLYIEVYIPRQLTFDEVLVIEKEKARGTCIVYWKLPWWQNWVNKFILKNKGIIIRAPHHQHCRSASVPDGPDIKK